MRDRQESCGSTEDGCLRCESVPAAMGRSGNVLLLAPLDGAAGEALVKALKSSKLDYKITGPIVEIFCGDINSAEGVAIIEQVKLRLSPILKERIKGVYFDNSQPRTAEILLHVFLHAEPLSSLFDLMDVEWARTVLREKMLFSVYHPIVNAYSGEVFAYEALIRAHHPYESEVVGAGRLIYACEKLNLQNSLDQQARVTALMDAKDIDVSTTKLFLNFLPSSIYDPEVCLRTTMTAAQERGIPMNQLVFEVIETEQIPSMDRLRKIVNYYREQGAGIALDDISSGFASLQFLADLLPDYAKIDRNLVASAAENSSSRHTLESIVGLARKLDVKVIAEGIETIEQMKVCTEAGVDYMQGFLFAHPAAPPERVRLPQSMLMAAA